MARKPRGPRLTISRAGATERNRDIDQATRELVAAYARAWRDIADYLEVTAMLEAERLAADPLATLRRSPHLQAALAQVGEQLRALADQHGLIVQGALHQVVARAPDTVERIITAAGHGGFGFGRPNGPAIDAIVRRTAGRIEALSQPLGPQARAALHTGLVQGIAAGDHPVTVARRIVRNAEHVWGGQLTRAMVITRTEIIDAHREATRQSFIASPSVVGWVWMTSGGARTCPACLAMAGTVHKPEETLEGHPQCRCTQVPVLRGDTPATLGVPNGEQLLARLTPEERVRVLGPGRAALVEGGLPVSALATRTENPGWRPSWDVTPVRELTTRSL